MGAFGTGLYDDDDAADLRALFKQLWKMGIILEDARKLIENSIDPNLTVFWLVLADQQWATGHVEQEVVKRAKRILETGEDLFHWEEPAQRKSREKVLKKLADKLYGKPPLPKKVPLKFVDDSDFEIGELIGFQLENKKFTVLRVVGFMTKFGGNSPVLEALDWYENQLPSKNIAVALPPMLQATHDRNGNQVLWKVMDRSLTEQKERLAYCKERELIADTITLKEFLEHEAHPYIPVIRYKESDSYFKRVTRLEANSGLKRCYLPGLVLGMVENYIEWKDLEGWLERNFALEGKHGKVRRLRTTASRK